MSQVLVQCFAAVGFVAIGVGIICLGTFLMERYDEADYQRRRAAMRMDNAEALLQKIYHNTRPTDKEEKQS